MDSDEGEDDSQIGVANPEEDMGDFVVGPEEMDELDRDIQQAVDGFTKELQKNFDLEDPDMRNQESWGNPNVVYPTDDPDVSHTNRLLGDTRRVDRESFRKQGKPDDDGGDGDETRGINSFHSMWHSFTDLDTNDDPEQRVVMQLRSASDRAASTYPLVTAPAQNAVEAELLRDILITRYADAVRRSSKEARTEGRSVGDPRRYGDVLRYDAGHSDQAADKEGYQLVRTFDTAIRLRDSQRAMLFLRANPHSLAALRKVRDAAGKHMRGQYGVYAADVVRRYVGAATALSGNTHRFDPLIIPVFSSVQWRYRLAFAKKSHAAKPVRYQIDRPGVAEFLSTQLGMKSVAQQKSVELDAMAFFKQHFDINFSAKTSHPPRATMRPYINKSSFIPVVLEAEGHLGSWFASSAKPSVPSIKDDAIGNGRIAYWDTMGRTSVSEVGWVARANGATYITGFWMIRRPGAAPALLRFQSASPTHTRAEKNAAGIRHVTTIDTDVYDILHDAQTRPRQGIGRARTEIVIERVPRSTVDDISVGAHWVMKTHTIVAMRH